MPEPTKREIWIFGYGSLMWQPGFKYAEAVPARIRGYHRAFCVYSVHYRGSPKRPGLVLGLDRGGMCEGIAFRLAPASAQEALAYLRQRELIYAVYREALVPIEIMGPHRANAQPGPPHATTFIAEHAHPAYAGHLPLKRQIELIRGASGCAGTNLDYVLNTLEHIHSLSIAEPRLARLKALAGAFAAKGPSKNGARDRSVALSRTWAGRPLRCPRTIRDHRFGHRAKIATLRGT